MHYSSMKINKRVRSLTYNNKEEIRFLLPYITKKSLIEKSISKRDSNDIIRKTDFEQV